MMSKKTPRPAKSAPPAPKAPVPHADDSEVEKVKEEAARLLFTAPDKVDNALSMYLRELRNYPVLTPEEEQYWARLARDGDEHAIDKLVCHNLRFVVTIAKQYGGRGVDLDDLIQQGNEGLLKAVRKFDPDFGVKFISYAVYWCGQSVRAALAAHQQAFRLPLNRATQLSHIHRARAKLTELNGRTPTPAEIAEETGIPKPMVKTLIKAKQAELSLDSTEAPDGGPGGIPLSERVSVEGGSEQIIDRRFRMRELNRALGMIRKRDEKILRLFYGLDAGREHTLEEIGSLLGITRERVRQLRDRALRDLRNLSHAEELEDLNS